MTVGVEDSARECIRSALRALDLGPASAAAVAALTGPTDENDASAANVNSPSIIGSSSLLHAGTSSSSNNNNDNNVGYQLWVRTKLDESPYPLIGHEVGGFT